MKLFNTEHVISVYHWNESMFSFKTTRHLTFRFRNGEFVMIGLEVENRPLIRAYSIASANYEENLEFLSIKVINGPLTSRLKNLKEGDSILISRKPVGTLVIDDLIPGQRLYLICSGTGLAPFLSIIKDPVTYERFDTIILLHSVRYIRELAYFNFLKEELPRNEFIGSIVRKKLIYYPTVTQESFNNQGRLTNLIRSGQLFTTLGLPKFDLECDRFMVCGSLLFLKDTSEILNAQNFIVSPHIGAPGHYVIERAFVDR